jgi:hypothetical protein
VATEAPTLVILRRFPMERFVVTGGAILLLAAALVSAAAEPPCKFKFPGAKASRS